MTKPTINLQDLRTRIGHRAKSAPAHRFWGLYAHVRKIDVLEAAYRAARLNRGAPGIDGTTFEDIEGEGLSEFIKSIASSLHDGTYKPLPYRQVEIPKGNGRTRTIMVAAIRDRVVQGAVKLILEPIFEKDFSGSSFGARPGRQAHEAIDRVRQGLRQQRHRVVDLDLAAFFDNITHHVLLTRLAARINDPDLLALLKQFLKSTGKKGIPQGSPLSPLLANVALDKLDHALDRGKGCITYVRFLDDMVILAHDSPKGRHWADRALQRIRHEAAEIGVMLNEEKTRVLTITEPGASFTFLGFEFKWKRSEKTGTWYPWTEPKKKAVIGLREKVREVLQRNRHKTVVDVVSLLNPILRGWTNYFRIGNSRRTFDKVRQYVEERVRRFAAKQRQRIGFGWKRWSSQTVYGEWGLFNNYKIIYYAVAKAQSVKNGNITPAR